MGSSRWPPLLEGGEMTPRWWLAIVGIAGIAAGLVTFYWPGITALVLITLIGAWILAHGVMEIIGAIKLRNEIDNEWLLILSGLGIVVLAQPGAGALALRPVFDATWVDTDMA
jgi:uncharacterized membrane protein HdeD (DUF308 family)